MYVYIHTYIYIHIHTYICHSRRTNTPTHIRATILVRYML